MPKLNRLVFAVLGALLAMGIPANTVIAQPTEPVKPPNPALEFEPNLGWLNTDRPLRFTHELKGHIVLIDFWTYCCINCHNVVAELEYLEEKYADEPFIVIGVHSAKFESEGLRANVRNAMFRYGIAHPVVVDDDMQVWDAYLTNAWPTLCLVGSDAKIVGAASGEGHRDVLDREIAKALAKGKADGTLAKRKFKVKLDAAVPSTGGLSYPGKVYASSEGDHARLFIADSTNDRIVVTTWPDESGRTEVVSVFGGERGFENGKPTEAQFDDPQGMVFDAQANVLYVADTRNHSIRAIDLTTKLVRTLVGNGEKSLDRVGGGGRWAQGLNSPWALELSPDKETLYVAMAGPHQLWSVDISTGIATAIAGGNGESIADGKADEALLAQPSSLALSSDGTRLYFADSEVSAVRFMNLRAKSIGTLVGVGLFDFGDIDGRHPRSRLQHPLGVTVLPAGKGRRSEVLLVADTYNSKIKEVNPKSRFTRHWAGGPRGSATANETDVNSRKPAKDPTQPLELNEPGGLHVANSPEGEPVLFVADTNNHRILMIDPSDKSWKEVMIAGLEAGGGREDSAIKPIEMAATVSPIGKLELAFDLDLPRNAKINSEAPVFVMVRSASGDPIMQSTLDATDPLSVTLPSSSAAKAKSLLVELSFGYCFADESICKPAEIAWKVAISEGFGQEIKLAGRIR